MGEVQSKIDEQERIRRQGSDSHRGRGISNADNRYRGVSNAANRLPPVSGTVIFGGQSTNSNSGLSNLFEQLQYHIAARLPPINSENRKKLGELLAGAGGRNAGYIQALLAGKFEPEKKFDINKMVEKPSDWIEYHYGDQRPSAPKPKKAKKQTLASAKKEKARIEKELKQAQADVMKANKKVKGLVNDFGIIKKGKGKAVHGTTMILNPKQIRGQKVSELMKNEGLSLGEASKKLKEMGE